VQVVDRPDDVRVTLEVWCTEPPRDDLYHQRLVIGRVDRSMCRATLRLPGRERLEYQVERRKLGVALGLLTAKLPRSEVHPERYVVRGELKIAGETFPVAPRAPPSSRRPEWDAWVYFDLTDNLFTGQEVAGHPIHTTDVALSMAVGDFDRVSRLTEGYSGVVEPLTPVVATTGGSSSTSGGGSSSGGGGTTDDDPNANTNGTTTTTTTGPPQAAEDDGAAAADATD